MMTCTEAADALDDLVFADLGDDTHARLNEHLAGCESCRSLEADLLELRGAVHGLPPEPGAALRERVRMALDRAVPAREPLWRRPVPAYAAATGMALCVVLAGVLARPRSVTGPVPRESVVESPGVPVSGGGLAFNLAEPFDTRVRGTADTVAQGPGLPRARTSRGDTL